MTPDTTTQTTQSAASQTVEVKIGDKAIQVDPAVAEALKASQGTAEEAKKLAAGLQKQMEELNAKVAAATTPAKKEAAKNEAAELATLMYTDPEEFIRVVEQRAQAAQAATTQNAKAQEQFWDEFYKDNKELKEFSSYVDFVFQRDLPNFIKQNKTVDETIKELGESVKKEILKMKGGKNEPGTRKPVGEGGSERNQTLETESEIDSESSQTTTTADILAERREARRAAKQPGRRR
jgi:hypothetical protein